MVLLDSNIFIVDRFFPRDDLYGPNKIFVDQLESIEAAISAFTLAFCEAQERAIQAIHIWRV